TLSGRAVVVRVDDGAELGSASLDFAHGVISDRLPSIEGASSAPLPPDWALQHPQDYLDVLKTAVPEAVCRAGISADHVIGISCDFTSCTVLPVTADGTPLSELPELAGRPHAWVKLWKHHAAQPQADRINALAEDRDEPWLPRYGGLISSEWQYAKGLQILEEDPQVYAAMDKLVEAADWIIWQLCGAYVRNATSVGYKGIWQDGHHASEDFCAALNPDFRTFAQDKLEAPIAALASPAGTLTEQAAGWTGLPAGITVAVGNVDAHVTAPAADAVRPGRMVAIMGTSTCLVVNADECREVPGMCGVVNGGIVDGYWGYEAGQSGVGDIFAWFIDTCVPGSFFAAAEEAGISVHEHLTRLASSQQVGEHGLLALDWESGNRSVLVDHDLSGLILGQTLATRPEDQYRALIEATAFGARYIVDAFVGAGVPVDEFIISGGLTKNAMLMQIYADVLNMPISMTISEQGPALGSAIHAAVAAGAYPDLATAATAMGSVRDHAYEPVPGNAERYADMYAEYRTLYDYFGRGANEVMHALRARRRTAKAT
ncbi:MAG: ribulokinase, partial [Propionibacteriaceae bacterium]